MKLVAGHGPSPAQPDQDPSWFSTSRSTRWMKWGAASGLLRCPFNSPFIGTTSRGHDSKRLVIRTAFFSVQLRKPAPFVLVRSNDEIDDVEGGIPSFLIMNSSMGHEVGTSARRDYFAFLFFR